MVKKVRKLWSTFWFKNKLENGEYVRRINSDVISSIIVGIIATAVLVGMSYID